MGDESGEVLTTEEKLERENRRQELAAKIQILSLRLSRMNQDQLDKTDDCITGVVRELLNSDHSEDQAASRG